MRYVKQVTLWAVGFVVFWLSVVTPSSLLQAQEAALSQTDIKAYQESYDYYCDSAYEKYEDGGFESPDALEIYCDELSTYLLWSDASAERIEHYDVSIIVNEDASLWVREEIVYNFGQNDRHGIYRDIPVSFQNRFGGGKKVDIQDISVVDENDRPYVYETFSQGSDRRIRVGDPGVLITGVHTYIIEYSVPRAVGYFDTFDEVYWNAVGVKWDVPIDESNVEVVLPQKVHIFDMKVHCYAGAYGVAAGCDSYTFDTKTASTTQKVMFTQSSLDASQGLTVAVGFPKGVVYEPTFIEKFVQTFLSSGWYGLFLPLFVFVFMYRAWKRYGRDPKGGGTKVVQYDVADGLSPMQVEFILKNYISHSITGEIVYLAVSGFLKISHTTKKQFLISTDEYELTKIDKDTSALQEYQIDLLDGLFSQGDNVSLADLKTIFPKVASKVGRKCIISLVEAGYFPKQERFFEKMVSLSLGGRIGVIVALGIITSVILFPLMILAGIGAAISLVLAVAVFSFFHFFMSRMTEKGVALKEHLQGFEQYLSVAEKDRINFHDAPKRNPTQFEKFLPFAIALGVEKNWTKVFEGIRLPQPSWYGGGAVASFNASHFTSSISRSISSASGSSGSGSSGGGGGGGGGGSW